MTHTLQKAVLALAIVLAPIACSDQPSPLLAQGADRTGPRLLVILVVDQLRAQYFDDYRPLFTEGLGRLLREGAWYRQASYKYLNTVTCPGHSTIGTGTYPYRHGMILNAWYDREAGRSPTCTADPSVGEYSFSGLKPVEGDSSSRMLVPTLAEQVRKQRNGRLVALSLKPRSTVPMVGPAADAVTWFDDRGGWMTSLAYGKPSPPLQEYIAKHPPSDDLRKTWTKTLPEQHYRFDDDAPAEHPVAGWTRTFPHPLQTPEGAADAPFYTRWQRSPYSDEYLGRMAAAMIDSLRLGRGDRVDFLSVSFSALDLVGHAYGPRSHEVQDLLVRLDRTIGRLIEHLDDKVGRDRYVLALSADHGVSDIPEQTPDGGRMTNAEIKAALEGVLAAALGPGEHVVANQYTDHYLAPAAAERVRTDPQLRERLLDTLRRLPVAQQAFYGRDLASAEARRSDDPLIRAAALSYHPGRSGDLIMVPRRHWITTTSATTHGTANPYDQGVPVILFGRGVRPGVYDSEASPVDIAPTLAAAAGITLGTVDGRVLQPAAR